jgi:hypothetical protein
MRLSEAIRLGAMLHPQAFGWYQREGGTCAMGAAMDAGGFQRWPIVEVSPATCPACACVLHGNGICHATGAIIVHLNDGHRWTREQIADWVQTVEERETERTESTQDVSAVAGSV